ncbi:hypothetical protein B0T10DRAFT_459170 [Thelonectria olida]|uniref:Uncharacterized protein n=1 Tax=Thelonectria olida TaxID=1576542 RepID=A0A9P8W8A5_9HYPO|nr:hypothetical protein B0T10DRAFT_459170 [Thelonectria olida]
MPNKAQRNQKDRSVRPNCPPFLPIPCDANGVRLNTKGIDGRNCLQLSASPLEGMLASVAGGASQQHTHVEVIAVGDAVNVLYLKDRETTDGIDVFGTSFPNDHRRIVNQAVESACHDVRIPKSRGCGTDTRKLAPDWFNTDTQTSMNPVLHKSLTREALGQGIKIFEMVNQHGDGLTVYAAPWQYAFSAKMYQHFSPRMTNYDLPNALVYLHEYIKITGNQKLKKGKVRGWVRDFGHLPNGARKDYMDALLTTVRNAYFAKYETYPF